MEKRLSVLYFTNAAVRGGAEEHLLTLLRGLDRNLFRLHLVCPKELAEKLAPDVPAGLELIPLRLDKPWQLGPALRLARILRSRRIDVLHSHLFYSSLFASPIGWFCAVPFIVETPHVREAWRRGWIKSRYFVDRFLSRFVDRYVAVSQANARYLVDQKGIPLGKVEVIRNGCDLDRFRPGRAGSQELKAGLGFAPEDPVVTVVGRLEPQKGHRVLLDALPLVLRQFPSARLVCVGEGSLRSELELLAETNGVARSVRFVGQQARVEDWLALADLVVLPSLWEGLPLIAIEALAAGRPIVATAVDGTPEVVVNGVTGLTVPPGDERALARAVTHLLADPGRCDALSRAGREWVASQFDRDQQVRATMGLYRSAFPGRAAELVGSSGPSPDFIDTTATIVEETVYRCEATFPGRLLSLVLTGSLARAEGTLLREPSGARVLGDAEFLAVLRSSARLPASATVSALQQEIERALERRGVSCPVTLAVVRPGYLRKLPPSIFAYELAANGRVVWGRTDVLERIRRFTTAEIPREDAWRLLCNRMVEQLEALVESSGVRAPLSSELQYRTVKLYLDMATSYLVFAGAYAPSYRERRARLQRLAQDATSPGPFPLLEFAASVEQSTVWKLAPEPLRPELPPSFLRSALEDADRLFIWELSELTGLPRGLGCRELLRNWMARQRLRHRIRGWFHVLRQQGPRVSWRFWAAWALQARVSSPRYGVYAAASGLFRRLPDLLEREGSRPDIGVAWQEELRRWLPLSRDPGRASPSRWDALARDIVWNYRRFLVETRS